jgi:hypothetical protein
VVERGGRAQRTGRKPRVISDFAQCLSKLAVPRATTVAPIAFGFERREIPHLTRCALPAQMIQISV